ncbi:cytochrome P450 [Mycena polygramma]|nr:cytochrome P450 [Mycena polygramma]
MFEKTAVVNAKGNLHARLRAAMNIGFTAVAVRNYQSLFERTAERVTKQLEDLCDGSPVDILPLLSDATLSTTSEAAFGYSIQDLGTQFITNNGQIMALSSNQTAGQILGLAIAARLPKFVLRAAMDFPTSASRVLHTVKHLADQIGRQIVREKMDAARQGSGSETDIFDILLHNSETGERKNIMIADELAAQTGVLLLGGQDTTANTLGFGLVELARHPAFQEQLRAEIIEAGVVAYDSLPLLNAFIKEVLRLYPAEALGESITLQDTIIPVAEAIKTSTGELINEIPVRKGQILRTATAAFQRMELCWGEDAHEFHPSRWLEGTVYQGPAGGPYANLLTFHAGPRTCPGWRFAISEMQVFFAEFVGKFSFTGGATEPLPARFPGALVPVMPNGEKGAQVCVTRIQ